LALSSATTLTEALAQLNNNLVWEGDATKAQNYVEAARWLLFNRPRVSSDAGTSINYEAMETQLSKAEGYLLRIGKIASRSQFTRGRMLVD